jgi:hypothetical protein
MLSIPLTPYHFNSCYRTWSVHILSCHLRTSLEVAFCCEGNGIVAKSCRRTELPSKQPQSALESSFLGAVLLSKILLAQDPLALFTGMIQASAPCRVVMACLV